MENTKNTPDISISLDINDTLQKYLNGAMVAKNYRESKEGIELAVLMRNLNYVAIKLLENHYDETCCSKKMIDTLNFNVCSMNNMLLHLTIEVIMLI